jgi:DNA-directed RNA polymerase subunit M/transcription elongation factor TFIIS
MKFCTKCDNMYYIGINANDGSKLTYYCRSCGNVDESITEEGVCVINTQFKQGQQKFNHIINPYTKHDPTLPRIFNIRCPNESCKTNHAEAKKPAEVIFMRYDDANLKYIYICVECDTVWNTGT